MFINKCNVTIKKREGDDLNPAWFMSLYYRNRKHVRSLYLTHEKCEKSDCYWEQPYGDTIVYYGFS